MSSKYKVAQFFLPDPASPPALVAKIVESPGNDNSAT